jgi:hypothetical protein
MGKMIGVNELIELKKEKIIPEIVDFYVGDDSDKHFAKEWHKYSDTRDYPSLVIEDNDNLNAIDFRFVFKSTVFIRGTDSKRMIDVYDKAIKWNPERVFIFHQDKDETEIIDSKGLLSGIIK